ncbi:MAG: SDR family NAD(P)-dependent oxidoreductase [Alphaproteobacteria bacterium]|nr:SDR family NAD(P)-dependent oxidoreductase [Alphaproteobacteria bacterium]
MNASMQGRHALISGAGSGIGAAVALALAREGCRLSLCGRTHGKLQAQADHILALVPDAAVLIAAMDVSDAHSVSAGVAQAQAQFGAVHILVNNAGQAESQPFLRTDPDLWQRTLAVNLTGTYHLSHAVLPTMLEAAQSGTPGRIINIASTAGLIGYAYVSAYVAAKHGVVGLTKALALELAKKNITVNALCPGYTQTDIVEHAVSNIVAKTGQTPEQARLALAQRNPSGRLVQPEEVAHSVVWLCRSGSDSINGQALAIDGGEQAA